MAQNFWENDALVTPQQAPTGGISLKPREKPDVSTRLLSADEAAAQGLDPAQRWQVDTTGKLSSLGKASADEGKALPAWAAKPFEDQLTIYSGLAGAADTFKDEFGGNTVTGGLENWAQGKIGSIGSEGQRDWWAQFKQSDNIIRNKLFGATLTPSEQAAYAATSIEPSMDSKEIRLNLQSRREIVRKALGRKADFLKAQGYSPDAISALAGEFAGDFSPDKINQDQGENAADPTIPPDAPLDPPASAEAPDVGLSFDEKGNVIHANRGGRIQGGDTGLIGEEGGSHSEIDPRMAGANSAINAMLKSKASNKEIVSYLRGKGTSEAAIFDLMIKANAIKKWQKENPGYKGDFNVDIERIEVPNSGWQNFANSDVGVAAASAADAATGFSTDNIIGLAGGDAEEARRSLDAAQAAHPKSAIAGTVAGGVGSALSAEAALAAAGVKKGFGRALGADMAYGATAGAGGTDYAADGTPATVTDRLTGAAKGAGYAAGGNVAGTAIASGAKAVARGSRDPYVSAVNAEAIPTTIGQQYGGKIGGIIKRTEDRIAGLPLIGDIIQARRVEGIRKFNERAFDRALEPIGVKIDGNVGEEAVDFAQTKISESFEKALAGKAVQADNAFSTDLTDAVVGVKSLKRVGDEVADSVQEILEPYMTGTTLTGDAMQQISRELRDLKASYFRASEPQANRIGKSIDKVEEAIFGPFRRQSPEVLPAYNKAKVAQRRLYTLADAVNKAKNKEGIFMPSQLGQADRSATIKTSGKVNAARGKGEFHDLQRAAQKVLPSEIPDSGTAGRIIVPGIALGVGGTSDASGLTSGAGTTLAGVLSLAYTRAGQRLLTKPGRGIGGKTGRVLQSDKTRRALTAGGAATGAALASQQ